MDAGLNGKKTCLQHCVYLASDGGRVCRPLVIADKGISRIKQHHMKELMVSVSYTFILETKKVACENSILYLFRMEYARLMIFYEMACLSILMLMKKTTLWFVLI